MNVVGTVNDVLKVKGKKVWSISPDATVFDAVRTMSEKNVGALIVMEEGKLAGLISERDYARKIVLMGKTSKQTPVRGIMIHHVICTTPESTVQECMRIMTDKRIRHLPVMQGEEVAGLVSIGDLVNWIISTQQVLLDQMESYMTGKYPG